MQQLQGAFSSQSQAINMSDSTLTTGWTPGTQTITQASAQPTIINPWIIYGWGIQFAGALNITSGPPTYGRLGKLIGALIRGGVTRFPVSGAASSANHPCQPLPPNALDTAQTLWDGSIDPPFPVQQAGSVALQPIAASFQLPQPISLTAGESIGIGMWLTPSLVSASVGIQIMSALWTINYDYGKSQ